MRTQLVGHCHPMNDQVFAGPAGRTQRRSRRTVGDQGAQSGPVGAQRIGKHKGVEPVVFVARRAVTATQILELVGTDHHHGDARIQQRVDQWSVGAFDGHFTGFGAREHRQQFSQTCRAVLDGAAVHLTTLCVDDGYRVIVTSPIDSACESVGRLGRQHGWGILHYSLLAADPSGEAPSTSVPRRDAGSLTVRRSTALSPVDRLHAPGTVEPRRTQSGHSHGKRQWR